MMFRLGSLLFVPAYLTVILYRPFVNPSDDGNVLVIKDFEQCFCPAESKDELDAGNNSESIDQEKTLAKLFDSTIHIPLGGMPIYLAVENSRIAFVTVWPKHPSHPQRF